MFVQPDRNRLPEAASSVCGLCSGQGVWRPLPQIFANLLRSAAWPQGKLLDGASAKGPGGVHSDAFEREGFRLATLDSSCHARCRDSDVAAVSWWHAPFAAGRYVKSHPGKLELSFHPLIPKCCLQIPETVINVHLDAGCSAALMRQDKTVQSGKVPTSGPQPRQTVALAAGIGRAKRAAGPAHVEAPDEAGGRPGKRAKLTEAHSQEAGTAVELSRAKCATNGPDPILQPRRNALDVLVRSSRALSTCREAHLELPGK